MADLAGNDRYCIIGAGASGLAIAKNFKQRGIPFDCLEREVDLGGLWNIGTDSGIVYETTHLVSASYSTSYDDLPMGDEAYPALPQSRRGARTISAATWTSSASPTTSSSARASPA